MGTYKGPFKVVPCRPWTCIADVETQYERRGGAQCIENEAMRKKFLVFAEDFEDCTSIRTPSIMDTHYECDTDCDTDCNTDCDCDTNYGSDGDMDMGTCMHPQKQNTVGSTTCFPDKFSGLAF